MAAVKEDEVKVFLFLFLPVLLIDETSVLSALMENKECFKIDFDILLQTVAKAELSITKRAKLRQNRLKKSVEGDPMDVDEDEKKKEEEKKEEERKEEEKKAEEDKEKEKDKEEEKEEAAFELLQNPVRNALSPSSR